MLSPCATSSQVEVDSCFMKTYLLFSLARVRRSQGFRLLGLLFLRCLQARNIRTNKIKSAHSKERTHMTIISTHLYDLMHVFSTQLYHMLVYDRKRHRLTTLHTQRLQIGCSISGGGLTKSLARLRSDESISLSFTHFYNVPWCNTSIYIDRYIYISYDIRVDGRLISFLSLSLSFSLFLPLSPSYFQAEFIMAAPSSVPRSKRGG